MRLYWLLLLFSTLGFAQSGQNPPIPTPGAYEDPRRHGAVCDGFTDDSAAFTSAMTEADIASGSRALLIPPSQNCCYIATWQFKPKHQFTLFGMGRTISCLKINPDTYFAMGNHYGGYLIGLQNGSGTNHYSKLNDFSVITTNNGGYRGDIIVLYLAWYVSIERVNLISSNNIPVGGDDGIVGINLVDSSRVAIDQVRVEHWSRYGLQTNAGSVDATVSRSLFTNNRLREASIGSSLTFSNTFLDESSTTVGGCSAGAIVAFRRSSITSGTAGQYAMTVSCDAKVLLDDSFVGPWDSERPGEGILVDNNASPTFFLTNSKLGDTNTVTAFNNSTSGTPRITYVKGVSSVGALSGTRQSDFGTGRILLGKLTGANFNSTSDQAIPLALPNGATKYILREILVKEASTSLTTAAGGVYTATSKGGTAVVAAGQVYSALTAAANFLDLTLNSGATTDYQTATTLYLSLTTPQGGAATADVYVLADVLP